MPDTLVPATEIVRGERAPSPSKSVARMLIAWLYVLVGLCLLPTLAVAVVFMVLEMVPPSQEVLFAFSEGGNQIGVTVWPMRSYIAAQLATSLLVWYSARLLCAIAV